MRTIEQTSTAAEREAARLLDWRFDRLVGAGYAPARAWLLASASHVDVRVAEQLLARGCPPATAERILL